MPLNFTAHLIEFLAKVGLAYDLKEVTENVMENRIKRSGDGSHPVYGLLKDISTDFRENECEKNYESENLGNEIDAEKDSSVKKQS